MRTRFGSYFNMQFITSGISTMLILFLLGLVVFFVMTANNLSVYVRENISFSIQLSDDMKEAAILKFQEKLDKKPYVKQSTYISKKQALQEQTEAMGTDPAEFLGYNPFKASIEIKLNADYTNSDSVAWITEEIRENKQVMKIKYPQDLLDEVNQTIERVSVILLCVAALLTLISFALINNTIRLAVYSKRFLIHTMKLVGASWSFIRRPFLLKSLWTGVIAAILADGVLIGIACLLTDREPELSEIITPQTMAVVMVSVLLFGIIITTSCAFISINKYLRMKVSELYYK